jgi:hypothetical protein
MVTWQVLPKLRVHPDQPPKADSTSDRAFNVTAALGVYSSEQSAPQSIPASVLVTLPLPDPALMIVREYCSRPVPLRETKKGFWSESFDGMDKFAPFGPPDVGKKATWIAQLPSGATVCDEHPSLCTVKSLAS